MSLTPHYEIHVIISSRYQELAFLVSHRVQGLEIKIPPHHIVLIYMFSLRLQ